MHHSAKCLKSSPIGCVRGKTNIPSFLFRTDEETAAVVPTGITRRRRRSRGDCAALLGGVVWYFVFLYGTGT